MEVRIGVTWSSRELEVDLDDAKGEGLQEQIEQALAAGSGLLWLTDKKGKRIGVPVEKVAYVEIGTSAGDRKVGFGLG